MTTALDTSPQAPTGFNLSPFGLQFLALTELYPSPSNPRKHFDGLAELSLSIARKGIQIPLIVRERDTPEGRYEVVDGERRYRAAQMAGVQFVPAILRDLSDAEVLELQIENALQRDDLTPLEEARGFTALIASNPAKYSAAYIADRISRSERFVVDRMRLLRLIPELQRLLDAEQIGVAHADLLSKLTPADQARAIDPGGARGRTGGLWVGEEPTLAFDPLREEPDTDADPYAGMKVATVKELEAWIARHIRFDVDRMAETAPLEFARVQGQVATAAVQPGRGRKVIHITHDHHLADEVKDPSHRVYGPRSWKRADGTSMVDGFSHKEVVAETCEHAVLGLVVVGPEYGTAFKVCIARDRCETHWRAEIRAKQKTAQLRASGRGQEAESEDLKRRKAQEAREAKERAALELTPKVYAALRPELAEKLSAAVPSTMDARMFAWLWVKLRCYGKPNPKTKPADYLRALVCATLEPANPTDTWGAQYSLERARNLAKAFGVDAVGLEKRLRGDLAAQQQGAAAAARPPKARKVPSASKVGTKPAKVAKATNAGKKR